MTSPWTRAIPIAAAIAFQAALPLSAAPQPPPTGPAQTGFQTEPVDVLVDADWLLGRIDDPDVVVVHAERRPGAFAAEHVAGARRLRFQDIAWDGEHGWVAEFKGLDETIDALRAAGIRRSSRVVIYGASMTAAARTWATFDMLGLGDRAFLLDGGLDGWKQAGGPVASGEPAPVERGDVSPDGAVDFRVSADWVRSRLGDPALALLDARPDDEYTGDDGGLGGLATPGHIPGAAQLYWRELMDPASDYRFRPREEIARIMEDHGAAEGRTHVVYCMIGMRASVVYAAARMLGLHIRFYDGSWRDWGTRDGFPAETGPDPRDGRGG